MSTPQRLQRRRTRGWRAPAGAVYVGRGSLYGNPYRIVRHGHVFVVGVNPAEGVRACTIGEFGDIIAARVAAVAAFEAMLRTPGGAEQAEFFAWKLHGRDLMCWCPLPAPGQPDHCHAAVLLRIANGGAA